MIEIMWADLKNKENYLKAIFYLEDITDDIDKDILEEIQAWCQDNNCGKRMSYDMFMFRNQKEKTMFLLKWS